MSKEKTRLGVLAKSPNHAPFSEQAYLTDKQQQIMQLTIMGHSHVEIGKRLGLSPHTIKRHRAMVYSRIRADLGVEHVLTRVEVFTHLFNKGAIYMEPTDEEVEKWYTQTFDENGED